MEDESFLSRSLNKTHNQLTRSDQKEKKKRFLMLGFKHVSTKTHNQSTHSDQKEKKTNYYAGHQTRVD
jgi:hypothetical protein